MNAHGSDTNSDGAALNDTFSHAPQIVSRADHPISRANINPNALKVLYRLKDAGYEGYLVGGGVRDLLLGREPKDFDLATNASPDQVRELFRNCRLVGRRFRLAHVTFGRDVIEVATFRAAVSGEDSDEHVVEHGGRIVRDNVYGTLEEDAWRRDFTVNALYYNINDFSLVDFTNGLADLRTGTLRLIGDPLQRYREDPVRMLRAARFMVKLGFQLHPDTEQPLFELAHLLQGIPAARLYEEVLKLFLSGTAVQTFEVLKKYGLFRYLFPSTDRILSQEYEGFPRTFVVQALANTDERIAQDKPVTPAFLFAALLWEPMRQRAAELVKQGMDEQEAAIEAANELVHEQVKHVAFPKRFSIPMREIWGLQPRLERVRGRSPGKLLANPRFRAAYDFLLLRAQSGEPVQELADWWTKYQTMNESEREGAVVVREDHKKKRRRRRRRGGGAAPGAAPAPAGGE